EVDRQAAAVERVAAAAQGDAAGHDDYPAVEVVGRRRAARGFVAAGDGHAAGRVDPLDAQRPGVGVGHRGAGGGQAQVPLADDDVARQYDPVLPVLQLDPVGRVVDRLVRVEPGEGLAPGGRARDERDEARRGEGGGERADG